VATRAAAVPAFVAARRSIRAFLDEPVPTAVLDTVIEAACLAPAPHHSRPWRWVVVSSAAARRDLADGMGARWRRDLDGDGVARSRIDELVAKSDEKIRSAPALVLGCLTWDGLDRYPDETRQRAEFGMALLSLGAAVENLMLAVADAGYASCWVAAPIFCPDEARDALALPPAWRPHAMVLIGKPDPAYVGRERPPVPLDDLRLTR
jgi:coenzyme F420-0:L-glutamate ligase/coenzyme F420-1:gamma-L-glutamate ligase